MNTINKWDYAPPEATHHAVDSNGRGFWHAKEPIFDDGEWFGTVLWSDRDYWEAAAAHSLEARPTPITADALEAAGWTKGREYYWKTYRASWQYNENREGHSVRVAFNDDYFPGREFMVWLAVNRSTIYLPKIKTMEQLETLLDLVGEESAPFEHATERKVDRDTPEE